MSAQNNGGNLLVTCKAGDLAGVRSLVVRGASVDFKDWSGSTPASYCCYYGHSEILQYLLEEGANTELADDDGSTPLHIAALHNSALCVTVLLQHGVVLDATNRDGETALWLASINGHLPIVQLLVEGGADIDRASKDGRRRTPLDVARQESHAAVAKYLNNESKWRRMKAWAMVRSSVRDEEALTPMLKVLLCVDLAREIQSYL